MTKTRNDVIDALGTALEQAARSSVAKGAFYAPGEHISMDSKAAWRSVAESLASMMEIMVREKGNLPEKTDVP
jgi:hypothetical protein